MATFVTRDDNDGTDGGMRGGCGATLSPAQQYCPACGRSAQRHVEITLEPLAPDPARAAPPSARPTPPASSELPMPPEAPLPPNRDRPGPPGWPVVTAVLLAVATLAIALTLLSGGSRDEPADGAPTTAPPPQPTTAPATAPATVPTSEADATGAPSSDAPRSDPTTGGPPSSATAAPSTASNRSGSTEPPLGAPPLGEPLPYDVVAVDNTGTALVFDLATGTVAARELAVGSIRGEPITDVIGGPSGPVVVRASLSKYHLIDLEQPDPVEIDVGRITALDEESGWVWFSTCRTPPCPNVPVTVGYGPGAMQGRSLALPAPTTRVVATAGRLFVEAAGTIVSIDPLDGTRTIVATGTLLDARGSTVVVRSCDPDLACPVVLHDADGIRPPRTLEIEGDDIRLSPDGTTIATGSTAPSLARSLTIVDIETGESFDIGSDALRFVSVPFRWTPDGKWLIGATGARALVIVRVADGVVHRVQFPGLDNTIAGLFVRAHPVTAPER